MIEIYVGEYVISMTDKIIECKSLLENLMQSIQLEKFRRGERIILKPIFKEQD
jgi:hypothetical protein